MASGFRNSSGQDTDDLFDADVVGDGPVATFMRRSDGSPLRYAAARYGTPGAPLGFRDAGGSDMGPQWARKGTATYTIGGLNGRTFSAQQTALTSQSQVSAYVALSINANGTWQVYGGTGQGGVTMPAPNSGSWLTNGSASDYQVQFDVSSSGYAGYTASNGAPSWTGVGASPGVQLTLPTFPGNNTTTRNANATVRIRIRNASTGAVVSDTTVYLHVSTQGFV